MTGYLVNHINLLMSSSKNISRIFYSLAAICILLFAFFSLKEMHNVSGWLLMAFFLSIAFAFRGSKTLKGLSYTMMIMGVASIAMYHPQYFKTIGDYKLSALIIPLLQIIMFGMGTELSWKDFSLVLRVIISLCRLLDLQSPIFLIFPTRSLQELFSSAVAQAALPPM